PRHRHELRGRVPARRLHLLLDHLQVHPAGRRSAGATGRAVREARVTDVAAQSEGAGRQGGRPPLTADRAVGTVLVVFALLAPLILNEYWIAALLTQMLFLGI